MTLPYKHKTQPKFSDSSPLLRTPYSPLSITLPAALPNALPCFPAYLCQKDERALLWNLRSCNFFISFPRNNNNNKFSSVTAFHPFLSLSLSLSLSIWWVITNDIITGNFRVLNATRAGNLGASVNHARWHYFLLCIRLY